MWYSTSYIISTGRNTEIKSIDLRHLNTLKKIDYQLITTNKTIVGYGPISASIVTDAPLKTAFHKKINKLLNYYVDSVDLFIYSPFPAWFEEDIIRGFMNWTINNGGAQFRRIMVYEYPYLYVFETSSSFFSKTNIDKDKLLQCKLAAKAYVDSI